MPYTKQEVLLGVSNSNITSNPVMVAAMSQIGLSLVTQTGAGVYAVHVSNADGFATAIPDVSWSTATTVGAQGPFILETGSRWMRVTRGSASSATWEFSGLVTT
jgi:hypothetical protein